MVDQERIQRPPREAEADTQHQADRPEGNVAGERLKAELDDILAEIDEVIEHNAEEFVNSYIQKGGQ